MDRKRFLKLAGASFGLLSFPKTSIAQSCQNLTLKDKYGAGPFYTPGAPYRVNLASEVEPGQRILIEGIVSNCQGPVQGANLDIWHATHSGCYKHKNDFCPDLPNLKDQFRLRGQVITDTLGRYSVSTIMPGAYLNGARYRPKHLHIIITHSSLPTAGLVTQLYFAGDPYITGDYAADDPSASNRIIGLDKNLDILWKGIWNIQLPSNISGNSIFKDPTLRNFDILLERTGDEIRFHLPSNNTQQPVEVRLYDLAGVLIKRSLHDYNHSQNHDQDHDQDPVTLKISNLNIGFYLIELRWWTKNGLRTESVSIKI